MRNSSRLSICYIKAIEEGLLKLQMPIRLRADLMQFSKLSSIVHPEAKTSITRKNAENSV